MSGGAAGLTAGGWTYWEEREQKEGRGPTLSSLRIERAWDGRTADPVGPAARETERERESIVEPDRAVELSVGGLPRLPPSLSPPLPLSLSLSHSHSFGSSANPIQSSPSSAVPAQLSPAQPKTARQPDRLPLARVKSASCLHALTSDWTPRRQGQLTCERNREAGRGPMFPIRPGARLKPWARCRRPEACTR